jgi:hypothetical protein
VRGSTTRSCTKGADQHVVTLLGYLRALAGDPDRAIEPAEGSALGRTGVKLGVMLGTVGEAIDNSGLGRLSRRRVT